MNGRDSPIAVCSRGILDLILIASVLLTLPLLLFPRYYGVVLLAALGLVPALIDRRRRVALTQTTLIYRPALGKPIRIPLNEITALVRCRTSVAGIPPLNVPAIRVFLPDGTDRVIAMDFPQASELQRHLVDVTGLSIQED